jgi:methylenetetrahydrofolate dehydrogenase (NADP+)/methenyltetrahydrofolate cyclohydrolase
MTQFAEPRQLYAAPIVASMELDLLERSMELGRQDIAPHLVAYTDENTSPTQNYLQMKEKAGRRLGVIVTVVESTTASLASHLAQGSADPEISGVILQLPVAQRSIQGQDERRSFTDMLLNIVPGNRDVDGLGELSLFTPATVLGVMQLLHHYDPDFRQKSIALYGDGRLVNRPLRHLLADSMGASELNSVDDTMTDNEKAEVLHAADIIIAATGDPHSLTTQLVGTDRSKLIIDAGTSEKPKEPKEMAKSKKSGLGRRV